MKKVLFKTFLLLSIFVMNSCSSNDDNLNSKNEIKMTVDGTELVFNSVIINANAQNYLGKPAIQITATINNSTDKIINIIINESATGVNSLDKFSYTDSGNFFNYGGITAEGISSCITNSNLNFVTSVNNGTTVSGNFSGNLDICNSSNILESVTVTKGSFNAAY